MKNYTKTLHLAMHLPLESQGLYTHCSASWAAIKLDTVHFPNPYPPAAEIDGDLADLASSLQKAQGGGPGALAALRVSATKVRGTFGLLGKYVQSVLRAGPIEDAPAILGNVLMYVSNIGKKPPKPELQIKQGPSQGLALLVALAVASAVAYFWEFSVDQVTWTAGPQTGQAHAAVAGLTPGKTYYFRFHALKRNGTMTELSQVVSFLIK